MMLPSVALVAALAAGTAAAGEHVILPGQEALVGQMLAGGELPGGCTFGGASIARTHIDVQLSCKRPKRALVVALRHPDDAPAGARRTGQFAVVSPEGAPPGLEEALARRIEASEAPWQWSRPSAGPPPEAPDEAAEDAPRDPDRPPLLAPAQKTNPLHAVLVAVLALLGMRALVRYPYTRALALWAGALFLGALAVRAVVPWTPANFYSDLETPFANFRHNTRYTHPFYGALFSLWRSPDAPFVANVLLGALVPPLLFLALRGGPDAPLARARGLDPRAALPFAAAIALLPLHARLSASEAPHVFGLFAFALGALLFARAEAKGSVLDNAGFLIAAYLVGATRRELAIGPLLYAFLALGWRGKAALRGASRARLLGLVLACVAGLFFTDLALHGRHNSELTVSSAQLAAYARNLPEALLLRDEVVPLLFRVGLLVLLVNGLWRRSLTLPLVYAAGMALFTLPYAFEREFAYTYHHPLAAWSFSRYALVWYLFPTWFGVLGAVQLLGRPPLGAVPAARLAVGLALVANAFPAYRGLHAYQAEYLFLRRFLAEDRSALPLVVGWQKYAGVDFCEALAQPFFALSGTNPAQRWVVLGAVDPWYNDLEGLDTFHYFSNTLPQIHVAPVTAEGGEVPELERAVAAFRRIDCLARRHGRLVEAAPPHAVRRLQFDLGDAGVVSHGIYRVERPASGWDFAACGKVQ